ncbi:MAG: hypothetical protein U9R75_07390 [Candidatus Thermoplasmatota archaeon]|nr:hypothetical protein [Candidatus Thermoplasmatota archaeon]
MGPMKKNCWDIKDCGRGPEGRLVKEKGECPVVNAKELDGVNDGSFGGRICWTVRTRDESGKLVPNWSKPDRDCLNCYVMDRIRIEEGSVSIGLNNQKKNDTRPIPIES